MSISEELQVHLILSSYKFTNLKYWHAALLICSLSFSQLKNKIVPPENLTGLGPAPSFAYISANTCVHDKLHEEPTCMDFSLRTLVTYYNKRQCISAS